MMKNNSLTEVVKQLQAARNIAIVCHVRPDGDALGSGLALTTALRNAGKNVYMLCDDQPPERLCIFDTVKGVLQKLPVDKDDLDAFVSVDSADLSRIGSFATAYSKFKGVTVNIDHHISNDKYGKINYVIDCPATCEIIPEILEAAGFEITTDIANLLALGLLTDSGNFSHQDVSSKTFTIAAKLKDKGADLSYVAYEMFSKQTKQRALLYGRVMDKMRFALDDRLVFITVTQKDFEETQTDKSQTEGFVDFPLSIEGVEVAAAVMEVKHGQYKVSLRSKRVNVNAIASTFGGGGHILASGCMLFGEYEEVIEKLTYAVYQNL
jgi:phosphoesterase RecJ-like protein